ncbi:MAG: hypothetical protein OIN86_10950 [Candidatus Methanoperedens sp.]|nr:hypothetical protein [Candidatus Methanoperedens sp.]
MDIFSILLFFIYSLLILGILVFVSPVLSAFIMILIPVVLVFIFPDGAKGFFSIMQFSYSGIQVFNLHILLLIWSAFIGVISYHKVLTWYLLREPALKEAAHVVKNADAKPADQPKTLVFKVKDFLEKIYKILKGEKIKLKP